MQSLGASTVSQVGVTTGASVGSGAMVSAMGASVVATASVDEAAVSAGLAESSPPHEASASNPTIASVAPIRKEVLESWCDVIVYPLVVVSDYKRWWVSARLLARDEEFDDDELDDDDRDDDDDL